MRSVICPALGQSEELCIRGRLGEEVVKLKNVPERAELRVMEMTMQMVRMRGNLERGVDMVVELEDGDGEGDTWVCEGEMG